jgi:ribosomal protein S18 acetylase RimI-like enzyme
MVLGRNWLDRKKIDLSPASIREFIYPQDFTHVHDLWKNAGEGIHLRRSDEPEEIAKKLQRDPDLFLVAELDGEIVGTVFGGFDGRRGMMYHLAVAKEYRKQGIASKLVEELELRLRARGCIRYYLLVTRDNETAIRFYEKRGWERMELFAYAKDLG